MEGDRDPQTLVDATVGLPDLSPDGQLVVYRDEARVCPTPTSTWWECYYRIFTIPFTGGAEKQMTPNELRYSGFEWIPESESVGFAASWGDGGSGDDWFVAKVDTETPLVVDVVADSSSYALLSADWSVTGEIATAAHKPGGRTVLLVLDADGNEESVIAAADADIGGASWSPDGKLLAYFVYRGNNSELVVSAPDGTDRHLVASGDDLYPYRWSPDGSMFAYESRFPSVLVVCAGDGADCRTIAELENPFDLAWSPDGSVLAYIDAHRAWAIPVSGGDAWPLTPSDEWVASLDWAA